MSITYHVCKYTPTELLTALGGQCALLDEAPENFDLSDQVAHPNLCGFGKSVIQAALAGQVKELVLVNCCDTIRSAYDILKEFGNLDFLYLLDILHSQEGCSVQHARDQLLALAEAYRAYKGTQFDRAAFFAAFQSPPLVTGPHIAVLGAKMGSHLFSLVEETMPLPVENATCANNRRVAPPADQGDFAALMEDYARCLLGQLPCMRMTDNTARRALYNTPGLEGVVYHTLQFCDYYGFEYAGLRHQLPVPLLKIESDGTTQSREQLRTRLEAFAEGFGPQKGDPTMKKHGYFAGIDSGSATTDVVILDQDRTIVAKVILPTGAGASNGAQRALDQALQQAGLTQADLTATVTTGYGRGVIQTGDKSVTEITCHAKGAHFLHPAVRTVIDIGGQDSKVIRIEPDGQRGQLRHERQVCRRHRTLFRDDGPDPGALPGGDLHHRPAVEGGDHHLLHVHRLRRLGGGLPGGPEQGPARHRPRPEPVGGHPGRRPLPPGGGGEPLHDDRRGLPEPGGGGRHRGEIGAAAVHPSRRPAVRGAGGGAVCAGDALTGGFLFLSFAVGTGGNGALPGGALFL